MGTRITVCLKLVSQAQFTDSLCGGEAKDSRLASGLLVMNPADEYALEFALRLRDTLPDTVVTVLTMSPPSAEHILYQALAMGADEAVHVCDGAFAGSDTLVTAQILAAAMDCLPPQDLVVCGQKAIDSETGHIGPQLAALLKIPAVTNVLRFGPAGNGRLGVIRQQDNGTVSLECAPPAVLTVCRGVEMVRAPGILGLRAARRKPIRKLDRRALDIPVGLGASPTQVVRMEPIRHDLRGGSETADESEGVRRLMAFLRNGGDGNG